MNVSMLFLNTVAERGLEIQKHTRALAQNDSPAPWHQLKRLFHSIKSSAEMAGFSHLAHLAALAEAASEKHISIPAINDFADLLAQGAETPEMLEPDHPLFNKIRTRLNKTIQVLVIDDDPFISEIISASLDMDGAFSIRTAASGHEALGILDITLPDVIILDLLLEDMSGIDILNSISQRNALRSTPVIVLTGSDEPDIRRVALEAGASCFFQKPFAPADLIAAIKKLTAQT